MGMAMSDGPAIIKVLGNTLVASGQLGFDEEGAFMQATRELLEMETDVLTIDLSGVTYMGSGHVCEVALAMVYAKQHDRTLSLRATKRVAHILSLGGVDRLGDIEVLE